MTLAESLATTLAEIGVRVATHVPGHGATQTFEQFNRVQPHKQTGSYHEEVAFTIAHGAALIGTRSACIIKTHGMVKAMNSVTDALSCGTTAGFVTLLFQDPTGHHSDNIIDIEPILAGARMPFLTSSASHASRDLSRAYALSESLALPVALVINADEIELEAPFESPELPPTPVYERNIAKHLVCPIFAKYQYELLNAKLAGAERPRHGPVGMMDDLLPPAYLRAVAPYRPIFEVFQQFPFDFVAGDAGVSTLSALPPYHIVNGATYLGSSVPLAMGAYLAGAERSWAFTGDFSFIAAGHLGLIEAVERKLPIKVMIYANGLAQTTGGQPLELEHVRRLLEGYREFVRIVPDAKDLGHVESIIAEATAANELRIIVLYF